MTIVLLLLGLVVAIGIGLALELLRLSEAAPNSLDPAKLQTELSNPDLYRPMTRLFSRADFQFLASRRHFSPQMSAKLRQRRRLVMSLYLRRMRRDFHRAWLLCRLLAPVSQDPDFGAMLVRQFLIFHGLYLLLRLRSLVGCYGYVHLDIEHIADVLSLLRASARRALQTTDSLALQPAA